MVQRVLHRIGLLFRKDRESYLLLRRLLGFYPRHLEYYHEALLHKSSSEHTSKGRPINNERLEFLGDAILGAVVADIVYKHFTGKREGFLTNARSKLVQRETLNKLALQMGLDKIIKSATHNTNHNSYMCGNAFEALVGAIYLDRGYDYCMRFMETQVLGQYLNLEKVAYKEVNFKSRIIEWGQKNRVTVSFPLVEQQNEEHGPVFQSEVLLQGICAGKGKGYSKKESQQLAAKQALHKVKRDEAFVKKVMEAKSPQTAEVPA